MRTTKFQREEVVDFFRKQFKDQAEAEMAEAAVLDLVRRGVISSGKAAELLGVSRWAMPDIMNRHKIPAFDLLPGETMEEHLAKGQQAFIKLREE